MHILVDNIKTDVTEIRRQDAEEGWIGYEGDDLSLIPDRVSKTSRQPFGPPISCVLAGALSLGEMRLQ
jgi:hypothetical protein